MASKRITKRITVLIIAGALTGCAGFKPKVTEIKVPVIQQCPVPITTTVPALPINSLTEKDNADFDKVAKAYAASVKILIDAVKERELILDLYRDDHPELKK